MSHDSCKAHWATPFNFKIYFHIRTLLCATFAKISRVIFRYFSCMVHLSKWLVCDIYIPPWYLWLFVISTPLIPTALFSGWVVPKFVIYLPRPGHELFLDHAAAIWQMGHSTKCFCFIDDGSKGGMLACYSTKFTGVFFLCRQNTSDAITTTWPSSLHMTIDARTYTSNTSMLIYYWNSHVGCKAQLWS